MKKKIIKAQRGSVVPIMFTPMNSNGTYELPWWFDQPGYEFQTKLLLKKLETEYPQLYSRLVGLNLRLAQAGEAVSKTAKQISKNENRRNRLNFVNSFFAENKVSNQDRTYLQPLTVVVLLSQPTTRYAELNPDYVSPDIRNQREEWRLQAARNLAVNDAIERWQILMGRPQSALSGDPELDAKVAQFGLLGLGAIAAPYATAGYLGLNYAPLIFTNGEKTGAQLVNKYVYGLPEDNLMGDLTLGVLSSPLEGLSRLPVKAAAKSTASKVSNAASKVGNAVRSTAESVDNAVVGIGNTVRGVGSNYATDFANRMGMLFDSRFAPELVTPEGVRIPVRNGYMRAMPETEQPVQLFQTRMEKGRARVKENRDNGIETVYSTGRNPEPYEIQYKQPKQVVIKNGEPISDPNVVNNIVEVRNGPIEPEFDYNGYHFKQNPNGTFSVTKDGVPVKISQNPVVRLTDGTYKLLTDEGVLTLKENELADYGVYDSQLLEYMPEYIIKPENAPRKISGYKINGTEYKPEDVVFKEPVERKNVSYDDYVKASAKERPNYIWLLNGKEVSAPRYINISPEKPFPRGLNIITTGSKSYNSPSNPYQYIYPGPKGFLYDHWKPIVGIPATVSTFIWGAPKVLETVGKVGLGGVKSLGNDQPSSNTDNSTVNPVDSLINNSTDINSIDYAIELLSNSNQGSISIDSVGNN